MVSGEGIVMDKVHRGSNTFEIGVSFGRSWRLIQPSVYRYLPLRHVDAFFDTGSLKLSSFQQFALHVDEARQDREEGTAQTTVLSPKQTIFAGTSSGHNMLVLCASLHLSKRVMAAFSDCDTAIQINDVPGFANAVSRQLAGFRSGLSGHCIYGGHLVTRHVSKAPFELPEDGGGVDGNKLLAAMAEVGANEDLFLKDRRYEYQAEYRMLWEMDRRPPPSLILECPEARQFCRKVLAGEIA